MKRADMKEKKMWLKEGVVIGWRGSVLVAMLISSLGCQPAGNQQGTIDALEREVARLRAERANLDARSTVLDDKILVLERKLEKCEVTDSPRLKVVRLTPDGQPEAEEPDAAFEPEEHPSAVVKKNRSSAGEKRPSLVLTRTSAPRGSGGASARSGNGGTPSSAFASYGAENLGVVSNDAPNPAETVMAEFNEAYRHYTNREYEESLAMFARFVNANAHHAYADNAVYWRGECYLAIGKLPNAIGEFERLVRRYPKSEKAAAAIFKIGFIYDKLRDFGKAADYYFDVVERYPGTDEARRASRRVAEIKNRTGNVSGLLPTSGTR